MSKKKEEVVDIQKLSYEEAYTELEQTVQRLEAGSLPLAEALALYQRGMELAKQCNLQLDQAELSIKKLAPSGELVDFEPD
jgi:exodeoxyribonuclease VII small subunit